MALHDESVAENLRRYTQWLQACDAAIKTTQAQIDQERQNSAQRRADFKAQIDKDIAQVQRLETRERDIIRELEYYSVVKRLTELGLRGMETLLTKLKHDNIPILKMVEEVQKKHNIARRTANKS
ncbi:uncharacterized protein FTOL_11611 [Fusarium torulosum]|uniref:Uncharacterized protein n=1 Tax=Fusarium torulosum TaxID=33205 RepID=A0AAE8SN51_9HYPO|nr:uncharacterized protein FTOL_11611 [Fusarium torulosum]